MGSLPHFLPQKQSDKQKKGGFYPFLGERAAQIAAALFTFLDDSRRNDFPGRSSRLNGKVAVPEDLHLFARLGGAHDRHIGSAHHEIHY